MQRPGRDGSNERVKVQEAMRVHVIKTGPDTTLREAVDLFDLYQVTAVPIVDSDDRLLGILTERDVAMALMPNAEAGTSEIERLRHLAQNSVVSEVMTVPAICIDEKADVQLAAELMATNRVKRLPVTSEDRL